MLFTKSLVSPRQRTILVPRTKSLDFLFDENNQALVPDQFNIMSNPSNVRPDISAKQLTYSHTPDAPPSLRNISIHLPPGSRTILCGANGGRCYPITFCIYRPRTTVLNCVSAGKSTLLQILAGKRLVTAEGADVRIKGKDVFRDSPPGVTFLGTEWFICNFDCGSARSNQILGQ